MPSIKERITKAEIKINTAMQATPDQRSKRFEIEYDGQQYYHIRDTVSDSYYCKNFGVPMRFVHEDTASKLVGELNNAISINNIAAPASARPAEDIGATAQEKTPVNSAENIPAPPKNSLQETLEKLEQGVKDVFTSENYADYLKTMSRFYNYSPRNTVLIFSQNPNASLVAGYQAWQTNFDRFVKKGEKGIKIIAPSPYKVKKDMTKLDPVTQKPVIGNDGKPVTEKTEITMPGFKAVSVFDVSQTDGKPLPEFVFDLQGGVQDYDLLFKALEQSAPCPVSIEKISDPDVHGFYSQTEKRIAIREDMSQLQTLKTLVHEVAHSKIHDIDLNNKNKDAYRPDKRTREVEAESIAYAVCQHYGLDTSDYSFGYIAGWSKDRDLKELNGSLDTIQSTANEIITTVNENLLELNAERGQIAKKFEDPEKLAVYIGSIYEQVKKADTNKLSGVAALNMAGKRLQKLANEIPSPQSVSVNGILPLGYKALYDSLHKIGNQYSPVSCNAPDSELITFKSSLCGNTRDLSVVADVYAGLDNSLAKEDMKLSYAGEITNQARTAQIAHEKYLTHLVSLGIGYNLNDSASTFFEEYRLSRQDSPVNPTEISDRGDTFSIYQLNQDAHELKFSDYESLESQGTPVDIQNYDLIYTAPLNWKEDTLEKIYEKFNADHPQDFTGHSLSMSDVIVTKVNGDEMAYYVDRFGFKSIPNYWDSLKPPPPDLRDLVNKKEPLKIKLENAQAKIQSQPKTQRPEPIRQSVQMSH